MEYDFKPTAEHLKLWQTSADTKQEGWAPRAFTLQQDRNYQRWRHSTDFMVFLWLDRY